MPWKTIRTMKNILTEIFLEKIEISFPSKKRMAART